MTAIGLRGSSRPLPSSARRFLPVARRRGQHVQYKEVQGIHSRRAPMCGVAHLKTPAGYNAPARVAATFASLARHLASSPVAAVFRLALLSLLEPDRDPVVSAFWQEIGAEAGDKLRVAVARVVIADQGAAGAASRRMLVSLSEGIERRLDTCVYAGRLC